MEKPKEEKEYLCHHGSLSSDKQWKQPKLIAKSN